MSELYLRVALPTPLRRLFDYKAPAHCIASQLKPGVRVQVPFGPRKVIGILFEVTPSTTIAPDKLKSALAILDQAAVLPEPIFNLCQWTAQYYQHSLGDTFSWALPILLRQGESTSHKTQTFWHVAPTAQLEDLRLKRAPRQRQALAALMQHSHGVADDLLNPLGINRESLKLLEEKQLVSQEQRAPTIKPRSGNLLAKTPLSFNSQQQTAFDAIAGNLQRFNTYLLAGVTGSGKTEVYLQLIQRCLEQGKQALVLIPEINLGPQTVNRFTQRFNARIALLHSNVNDRQRLDAWIDAYHGDADIVIGTRSALFTPMPNLGLIIIDEEHDASYKQQDGLRYHARDVAIVRARQANIPIVLGSATPSLESLQNAEQGKYALLKLSQRAGGAVQPSFIRMDVKSLPLTAGLAAPVQKEIQHTLSLGQQVLVFINRRGFAPVLMCNECGWTSHCPRCDAFTTFHQRSNELRCHHCGEHQPRPMQCPKCHCVDLRPIGAGTERTEERLQVIFKKTPVLRIDRDTTQRKGSLDEMLGIVNNGKPCILVGTQMLAKGHHFPKVTLVVILDVDGGLFSADFRASERMAQQIIQVAGRAGRAGEPGRVIIQSQLADHPLLVQLTEQGYFAFAEQALSERRSMALPPFSFLALLRADGFKQEQVNLFLAEALSLAEQIHAQQQSNVELLGPVPAPMERKAGRYRGQLLLQSSDRKQLHKLLNQLIFNLENLASARSIRWSIDVDPIDLF